MGFWGDAWGKAKSGFNKGLNWYSDDHWSRDVFGADPAPTSQFGEIDPNGRVAGQSNRASQFADAGERGFNNLGREAAATRAHLAGQMRGENSISAEQLRQGLQQNIAGQQAMAAGARPGMAGMAARNAAMNAGRMGAGLSGQQAMAGIMERNAAAQSLGQMTAADRKMMLDAAQGSRQQALGGYGNIMDAGTSRYQADMGVDPGASSYDKILGAIQGAGALKAMSDRRLKTGIKKGDKDASEFLKGLKAYRFKYTDEKHGKGEQLGIMAQDLERSGLGKQAVYDTPEGKAVHGAKLATAIAATLPGLNKRLSKLEGRKA